MGILPRGSAKRNREEIGRKHMANEQNLVGHTFADKPENIGGGRPKGRKNRSTIIRELLALPDKDGKHKNNEYKMINALMEKAQGGDITAIREVQDTMYGKLLDKSMNAETTREELERDITDEADLKIVQQYEQRLLNQRSENDE